MAATIPDNAVRLALHPKQAEVWRSRARFRVIVAGRRFGKTLYSRTRLIASALQAPRRFWYIAPTLKMAKDIMWSDLKQAIHPSWLTSAPHETELRVHLKGGGEIQIHGAEDPDALRGRALGGAIFDEFADIKPEAWTEAVRPALADHRGWADFIGTPKSFNHLHELYLRGVSEKPDDHEWAAWQFRTVDNPFISPDEIEASRRDMDPRTFRQEYEASFEALSGRAYYAFSRADNVGGVTLQAGIPVSVTFDFNVNPATCVIGQGYHDECRVWREVFVTHAGGEATMASASKARALLTESGWRGEIRIYGDATGTAMKTTGPSDHAVVRQVFPMATWRVATSNPHPRDRVSAVNSRCQTSDGKRHLVVDRSCVRLIADLEQVIFDDKGELDQKSNPLLTHISDAFGYWVHREWPPVRKTAAAFASVEHLMV